MSNYSENTIRTKLYKEIGWLVEVCKNLEYTNNNNWTLEKCIEEALKYKTDKDFKEENYKVYQIALLVHRLLDLHLS